MLHHNRGARPAESRIRAGEAAYQRADEERRRWDAEERRRKEKERVDTLIADVERWHEAENLRAYVQAASESIEIEDFWETWALAAADAIDPLVAAVSALKTGTPRREFGVESIYADDDP